MAKKNIIRYQWVDIGWKNEKWDRDIEKFLVSWPKGRYFPIKTLRGMLGTFFKSYSICSSNVDIKEPNIICSYELKQGERKIQSKKMTVAISVLTTLEVEDYDGNIRKITSNPVGVVPVRTYASDDAMYWYINKLISRWAKMSAKSLGNIFNISDTEEEDGFIEDIIPSSDAEKKSDLIPYVPSDNNKEEVNKKEKGEIEAEIKEEEKKIKAEIVEPKEDKPPLDWTKTLDEVVAKTLEILKTKVKKEAIVKDTDTKEKKKIANSVSKYLMKTANISSPKDIPQEFLTKVKEILFL